MIHYGVGIEIASESDGNALIDELACRRRLNAQDVGGCGQQHAENVMLGHLPNALV